ncbi:BnaA09g05280D [Brassica napus]|uniref:BnaA09g05280D protein n=1 Tax=Brassica napus TaxID=3708 RepID=A0A078FUZ3_BRANA|nr:BnaA09g05280D [Brassica napus]
MLALSKGVENGHVERLAVRFSQVGVEDSSRLLEKDFKNDNLLLVIKAVEAAETTIKHQQVDENSRLKAELQRSTLELARYKSDESLLQTSNLGDHSNTTTASRLVHQPVEGKQTVIKASDADSLGMVVVHPLVNSNGEQATLSNRFQSPSEQNMVNGIVLKLKLPLWSMNSTCDSHGSISDRTQLEGAHVTHFNLSTHGFMPVGEVNDSENAWKQDLIHKVHENEQRILHLRRYLTDCSVKEAQTRNEKDILEKRMAYMRQAFDQQQEDLVDAASKALSYRQEIIEENIRLTYALQATQQEKSTFVSYLLPLLSEYSLQPQVSDAQSIVSNVKVIFKHLQEKLLLTETKLKESEYQLAPWQSDVNHSNDSPVGVALTHSTKDSLYDQTAMEWDSKRWHQDEPGSSTMSSFQFDDSRRFSPLVNGHFPGFEMPQQPGTTSEDESRGWKQVEDTPTKHVQFLEPLSKIVMDDAKGESDNTKNSPYVPAFDDPPSSSNSPLLSPVLEEPSSSSDEDEDDDPLPAIEDLQISGEPYPGHELQACGYSINGTTSCNFEWVCHLEDGSVNYIDGAKQPNYLVTADDVDLYLAIEVQPLDDRNRKGQLVKVFANENRKIACHPEMQSHIEKTLHSGHASYKVSVSTGFLNIWEEAMLSIKREGYSIKCSNDIMVAEKFSSSTSVTIPFGQPEEFVITGSNGTEYTLRGDHGSADLCCSRDAIVLTLRLFTMRALQRKKGKKKGFLFNK